MKGMSDVVAVVNDLLFQSRILAAARSLGREVKISVTAHEEDFALALVDLDVPHAIETIGKLRVTSEAPIIAFGPHVDTDKRKAARAAGADRVLAKSKFVTELPRLLASKASSERGGA